MNDYLYRLSKVVSHALRHAPEEYGLYLDKDGWVEIDALTSALKTKDSQWETLTKKELMEMVNQSSKVRHEIKDDKIRALYGHSTEEKIIKEIKTPPEFLYHGTSPEKADVIMNEGLKPMNRHYVHLSIDKVTAKHVGCRKSTNPVIFKIVAKEASSQGIKFYMGNDNIWLADWIPSEFIEILDGTKK